METPLKEAAKFLSESINQLIAKHSKPAINAIKKQILRVEGEMSNLIAKDTQLSTQMKLATSVTGIGPITAAFMIVTTNEFQDIIHSKKYSCYVGVAPFPHSSGKSLKRRDQVSHLANKKVKTLLHMGARSAVQHSPELKQY